VSFVAKLAYKVTAEELTFVLARLQSIPGRNRGDGWKVCRHHARRLVEGRLGVHASKAGAVLRVLAAAGYYLDTSESSRFRTYAVSLAITAFTEEMTATAIAKAEAPDETDSDSKTDWTPLEALEILYEATHRAGRSALTAHGILRKHGVPSGKASALISALIALKWYGLYRGGGGFWCVDPATVEASGDA
jgi:hypothetical protein